MIYRSRYNFPSSLQTQSWKAEGNILSYELLILQDNFRTSNYYMHLRNKERVNQVLARDFCISALPAPSCGMVITTMQRCSTLRRVRRRHFGIQTCALFSAAEVKRRGASYNIHKLTWPTSEQPQTRNISNLCLF